MCRLQRARAVGHGQLCAARLRLQQRDGARDALIGARPLAEGSVFLRQQYQHACLGLGVTELVPTSDCGGCRGDGLVRLIGHAGFHGVLLEQLGAACQRQCGTGAQRSGEMSSGLAVRAEARRLPGRPRRVLENERILRCERRMVHQPRRIGAASDECAQHLPVQRA